MKTRCKDSTFDGTQVTAAPGQSGSPTAPSEGWITNTNMQREQPWVCSSCARECGTAGWKGSPRADGCTLALGARAGGEGNWVGISSTELEKTGEKQEILAEPSPVAWLPEKESISQGSGGIRGGFQQLDWTARSPHFAVCTVADMRANYLLDIPNPCGLARGYCRQPGWFLLEVKRLHRSQAARLSWLWAENHMLLWYSPWVMGSTSTNGRTGPFLMTPLIGSLQDQTHTLLLAQPTRALCRSILLMPSELLICSQVKTWSGSFHYQKIAVSSEFLVAQESQTSPRCWQLLVFDS